MGINLITQSNWLLSLLSVLVFFFFSVLSEKEALPRVLRLLFCITAQAQEKGKKVQKSGACSLFFYRRWRDKRWFYCWWRYLFIRFALPRLSLVFLSLFTFSLIFLKIWLDSRHSRVKATWGDGARSETIFHHPFTFSASIGEHSFATSKLGNLSLRIQGDCNDVIPEANPSLFLLFHLFLEPLQETKTKC